MNSQPHIAAEPAEGAIWQAGLEVASPGDTVIHCMRCSLIVFNRTTGKGWADRDGNQSSEIAVALSHHAEFCDRLIPNFVTSRYLFGYQWRLRAQS